MCIVTGSMQYSNKRADLSMLSLIRTAKSNLREQQNKTVFQDVQLYISGFTLQKRLT
jgi:hypothetical protein